MNKILSYLWLILLLHSTRGSEKNETDHELEAEVEEVELPAEVYDLLQKAAWGDKRKEREERDLSDEYEEDEGSEDEDKGSKGIEDKPGLFSWFGSKSGPSAAATGQPPPAVQSLNAKKIGGSDATASALNSPAKQELAPSGTLNVMHSQDGQAMVDEKALLPPALASARVENNPTQLAGGMEQDVVKNEGNNLQRSKDDNSSQNQMSDDPHLKRNWKPNLVQDEVVKDTPSLENKEPNVQGNQYSQEQMAQFQPFFQSQQHPNVPALKPQIQTNDHQFQPVQQPPAPLQPKRLQQQPQASGGRYVIIPNGGGDDQGVVWSEPVAPLKIEFPPVVYNQQDDGPMQMSVDPPIETATLACEPEYGPPSQISKLVGGASAQKQFQQLAKDFNRLETKDSENQYILNQRYPYEQVMGQQEHRGQSNRLQHSNEEPEMQIWRQSFESPYSIPNEQRIQPGFDVPTNEVNSNVMKEPYVQRVNSKVDTIKQKDSYYQPYPTQTEVKSVNQQVQPKMLPQNWNGKMVSNFNMPRSELSQPNPSYSSNSVNEMNKFAVIGPEMKKNRITRDKILKASEKQMSVSNCSKVTQKSSARHSSTTAKQFLSFQYPIPPYPNDIFAKDQSPSTSPSAKASPPQVNLADKPSDNQLLPISKIRRIRDLKTFKQTSDPSGSTQRPFDGKARLFFQKLQSDLIDLQNSVLSQPKMMAPIAAPENDNMKVHVKVSFEMVPKDEHDNNGDQTKKEDDDA